ncbi:hypothetical protein DFS34DRAFT_314285 [Phlyctochytrium arcticum]|nr:hypothetical protein DFS34DRAFT_314285 [Phlyctochytrium arcticum]
MVPRKMAYLIFTSSTVGNRKTGPSAFCRTSPLFGQAYVDELLETAHPNRILEVRWMRGRCQKCGKVASTGYNKNAPQANAASQEVEEFLFMAGADPNHGTLAQQAVEEGLERKIPLPKTAVSLQITEDTLMKLSSDELTDQVREPPLPDVATVTVDLTTNEILSDEERPEQINYKIFQRLHAEKLILANEPLEYPPTSNGGVAVLYHTAGWKDRTAAFKDIQYSVGEPGGTNTVL